MGGSGMVLLAVLEAPCHASRYVHQSGHSFDHWVYKLISTQFWPRSHPLPPPPPPNSLFCSWWGGEADPRSVPGGRRWVEGRWEAAMGEARCPSCDSHMRFHMLWWVIPPLPPSLLLSASLCAVWPWVIIHTFLVLLSPRGEDDPYFLPQRRSHREAQQSSLPLMTHSPTSRASLYTACSPAPPHHALAWPGSQSLSASLPFCLSARQSAKQPVCLPNICLSAQMYICLPAYLTIYLSISLPVCLHVSLPVFLSSYPSACLLTCLSLSMSVCMSASSSVCPLMQNCKVKTLKDIENWLPCLHVKQQRLGQKYNDSDS